LAIGAMATWSARDGRAAPPLPRAHAAFGEDGANADWMRTSLRVDPPKATRTARVFTSSGCSDDMVRVAGRFCIDRYEASMIEDVGERPLSPYYPPVASLLRSVYDEWSHRLLDGTAGVDVPLPPLAPWQLEQPFHPRAVSRAGVAPQGYVSKVIAQNACANAGKRLCTIEEWTLACKGERNTKFPYGASYRKDACNVFRDDHPGMILHGSFSVDLLDPRLNTVVAQGEPLLRATGATPACKSTWGDDAVYDMVGNLDEWVDDTESTFVGGFYARSTRNGCDSKITAHGATYLDYSIGTRCCDRLR
jgi:hypothetical protein